ncbi:MAG TPA: flagellar hook-length control protein FliK [Phycisphaerae bacterium]|nr:flagellar hook-length control protein FliK [Phycisphaerae bacterium]
MTHQPKTSRGKPAFSVERVGSKVVVSRGKGQTPATDAAGVPVPAAVAERSGPAPGRAGFAHPPQPPAPGAVADQVAESIRVSGAPTGRQIVVQLQPPDLGRVRIIFRSEGDAVRGVVRVDNPETLSRLEREAAPLMERLQASGIEVRRLDVMLNDSHDGDTTQNPAFRGGQDRQNGWVGDNPSGSLSGDALADAGQTTAESTTAAPDAGIGGGAINVRI